MLRAIEEYSLTPYDFFCPDYGGGANFTNHMAHLSVNQTFSENTVSSNRPHQPGQDRLVRSCLQRQLGVRYLTLQSDFVYNKLFKSWCNVQHTTRSVEENFLRIFSRSGLNAITCKQNSRPHISPDFYCPMELFIPDYFYFKLPHSAFFALGT